MKKLDLTIPKGLTVQQASKMINENKNPLEKIGEDVFGVPVRVL